MGIGVFGVVGEYVVGRVMEGRCGGIVRVIIFDRLMEEEFVGV